MGIIDEIYSVMPGLRIWRISHCSFLIKYQDILLVIDPAIEIKNNDPNIAEEPINLRLRKKLPVLARDLKIVHLVLISHADADHCGSKSIAMLEPKTQVFMSPPETASKLRGIGVPYSKIRRAYLNEPLYYGGITVIPTDAHHHLPSGCAVGFYIETALGSIWFPGDSIVLPSHYKLPPPNVLLLPISEHVFGPIEGGKLANHLGVPHIIPCHYGAYEGGGDWTIGNLDALKNNVQESGKRIHILELGDMFHLKKSTLRGVPGID